LFAEHAPREDQRFGLQALVTRNGMRRCASNRGAEIPVPLFRAGSKARTGVYIYMYIYIYIHAREFPIRFSFQRTSKSILPGLERISRSPASGLAANRVLIFLRTFRKDSRDSSCIASCFYLFCNGTAFFTLRGRMKTLCFYRGAVTFRDSNATDISFSHSATG